VNSRNTEARIYAIEVLGGVGPPAAWAVDALIKALDDNRDETDQAGEISTASLRTAAAHAPANIGDRKALPHLRKMTAAKNPDERKAVAAAIRKLEEGPRR